MQSEADYRENHSDSHLATEQKGEERKLRSQSFTSSYIDLALLLDGTGEQWECVGGVEEADDVFLDWAARAGGENESEGNESQFIISDYKHLATCCCLATTHRCSRHSKSSSRPVTSRLNPKPARWTIRRTPEWWRNWGTRWSDNRAPLSTSSAGNNQEVVDILIKIKLQPYFNYFNEIAASVLLLKVIDQIVEAQWNLQKLEEGENDNKIPKASDETVVASTLIEVVFN